MKGNRTEAYVKIMIYFCIFVIYSFSLLNISLNTITEYEELYQKFTKVHIETRINSYIADIENSLKAFSISSYTDVKNITKFKYNKQKVIDGLNLYNKLFKIEGKVYLVINNEEVYSSTDAEYYFESKANSETESYSEVDNSDVRIKQLISSNIIKNDKKMSYICDTDNTFYFIYPIYDSEVFANGHIIKECNLKTNDWIFGEILEIYDIESIRLINENGKVVYSNTNENSGIYEFKLLDTVEDISISINNIRETIEVDLNKQVLFNKYIEGSNVVIIIILSSLSLCIYSFFMKDSTRGYKIILFITLLFALLIGYVIRTYSVQNCIDLCEKNVINIKKEDILNEKNIKIRMQNGATYIKERVDYMYKQNLDINYVWNKKEDLILLARKTQRYLSPYTLGYYYTFTDELYASEIFANRSADETLKKQLKDFMIMNEDYYSITFKDNYNKTQYRLLTKSVDQDGKAILVYGLDFDFKNYNRRVALLSHMYNINNDAALYEIKEDGEINKIIVKNKEQEIYYQDLNKYVNDIDQEEIEQINKIHKEGKITGYYITGINDKRYNFYVKTMYDENYLVITIDSTSIEGLTEAIFNYETFILFLYVLFSFALFRRQLFFSEDYEIKEHEMHSNY